MITIAQANSFSNILRKNGLYKDADHVDKYILLASHIPIEKHAGLWDWVGGKLSGYAKRIFFKNFRQAYALAREVQEELDDQMDQIEGHYKDIKMYLNRHDLIQWQQKINEFAINIIPSDRLKNLQDRYNDTIQQMNKGIGLLSDEQLEEFKEEQARQKVDKKEEEEKEEAKKKREDETERIREERERIRDERLLRREEREAQKEERMARKEEEEAAKTNEGVTEEDVTGEDETGEEIPKILNPEEMTADQQQRAGILPQAPSEDYEMWNRSPYFYDVNYVTKDHKNVARMAMTLNQFKNHLKNYHFKKAKTDDGKIYFYVTKDPTTKLPAKMERTLASPELINMAWVIVRQFKDDNGIDWAEFAQVNPNEIEKYQADLIHPKINVPADRMQNTADYRFYLGKDGLIYIPRSEFDQAYNDNYIEKIEDVGPAIFVKLTNEAHPEWKNIFRRTKDNLTILRCSLENNDWVKIKKVSVQAMNNELGIRVKTPVEDIPEIEPEDIEEIGLDDIDMTGVAEPKEEGKMASKRIDKIIALAIIE